jgi:quercetin dioxygenase-like cupin family protein
MSNRYFVRADEAAAYNPSNHSGTSNRRLIGRDTVGATQVEVVLGTIEKNHGAPKHSHPNIEQVCYLLDGEAVAEVAGQTMRLKPGDCCFFPANVPHVFTAVSDVPAKVLVIYAPPYGEDPAKLTKSTDA